MVDCFHIMMTVLFDNFVLTHLWIASPRPCLDKRPPGQKVTISEKLDRSISGCFSQTRVLTFQMSFGFTVSQEQLLAIEEYDLNVVRLCFQAFLPNQHGDFTLALPPVVSNPIYDNSEYLQAGWVFKAKCGNDGSCRAPCLSLAPGCSHCVLGDVDTCIHHFSCRTTNLQVEPRDLPGWQLSPDYRYQFPREKGWFGG